MDLAIEAVDLHKRYPPDVVALQGMSLAVEAGTIFGLLGPNGAGKSTTVRVLCTLSRPDRGSARIAGIDVLGDPDRIRHAIGVVGQRNGAAPEATGRENLIAQGEFYGITGQRLRERVDASLERFGLSDAADRAVRTYSGGMQRRLDIAMGLLHEPQVLFLDEATTGLDPEARTEMWNEVERLASAEQMTILLTTHYMDEADHLASRLAIVDRGKVVAEGTPDELKGTLHGDAIQVELPADDGTGVLDALAPVAGVSEARLEGRILHARARNGAAAIPEVMLALEARGIRARSVTLARPSLDDVYLRYAGRTLGGAEAAAAQEVAA